ncbi:hypothetical protein EG330_15615 [Pectobacterium versatile]|nr:hypothetical protein EG330_15615 [Pectobacterium versatile]
MIMRLVLVYRNLYGNEIYPLILLAIKRREWPARGFAKRIEEEDWRGCILAEKDTGHAYGGLLHRF